MVVEHLYALTVSQLADIRLIAVKRSKLMFDIETLPTDSPKATRQDLESRLQRCGCELKEAIPAEFRDDSELMMLVSSPPKVLWWNVDRTDILSETVIEWIEIALYADHEDAEAAKAGDIADLKLLFFFGTEQAKQVAISIYRLYRREFALNKILESKLVPSTLLPPRSLPEPTELNR